MSDTPDPQPDRPKRLADPDKLVILSCWTLIAMSIGAILVLALQGMEVPDSLFGLTGTLAHCNEAQPMTLPPPSRKPKPTWGYGGPFLFGGI